MIIPAESGSTIHHYYLVSYMVPSSAINSYCQGQTSGIVDAVKSWPELIRGSFYV